MLRRLAAVWLVVGVLGSTVRAEMQGIELAPVLGEVGSEVEVAIRLAGGESMEGVAVRALPPVGEPLELGVTDASGRVSFRPAVSGVYELEARFPAGGPRWIAPYEVRDAKPTTLYAALCIPAGLVLLWWNLRRWRRQTA